MEREEEWGVASPPLFTNIISFSLNDFGLGLILRADMTMFDAGSREEAEKHLRPLNMEGLQHHGCRC